MVNDNENQEEEVDFSGMVDKRTSRKSKKEAASAARKKQMEQWGKAKEITKQTKKKTKGKTKAKEKTTTKKSTARVVVTKPKEVTLPKYKCVVDIIARVPRSNTTRKAFARKIGQGLQFIREEVDPSACIIPVGLSKKDELGIITCEQDMPKNQIGIKKHFFYIPNPNAFSAVNDDEGRSIRCTATMGFDEDPKEVLQLAMGDLREMGCCIYYNQVQELQCMKVFALLGVPTSIEGEVVHAVMTEEMRKFENKLKVTQNKEYPVHFHRDKPIKFAIIKEWPQGLPWDGGRQGQRRESGRMAFIIQVKLSDLERMDVLLNLMKQASAWRKIWGETAFTLNIPTLKAPQDVKDEFIHMAMTHGSVQMSLGAARTSGLYAAEEEFELRRLPDDDGNPRKPMRKTALIIFGSMDFGEGEGSVSLFHCFNRSTKGQYTAYFSSVEEV